MQILHGVHEELGFGECAYASVSSDVYADLIAGAFDVSSDDCYVLEDPTGDYVDVSGDCTFAGVEGGWDITVSRYDGYASFMLMVMTYL